TRSGRRRTTDRRQRPLAPPARWAATLRGSPRRTSTAGSGSPRAEVKTHAPSYVALHTEPAEQAAVPHPPRTRLSPSRVMNYFQSLERAPVLFTLVDPQLRRLARRLRPIQLGPGTRVIQADQAVGGLYL